MEIHSYVGTESLRIDNRDEELFKEVQNERRNFDEKKPRFITTWKQVNKPIIFSQILFLMTAQRKMNIVSGDNQVNFFIDVEIAKKLAKHTSNGALIGYHQLLG